MLTNFKNIALFKITYDCNQNCIFCHENFINSFLPFDYEKLKDFDKLLETEKIDSIMLSGGEPFMHKNIFDIIKYFKSKGYKVIVITNGINLAKDKIDKIKSEVDLLYFSLHSLDVKTDRLLTGGKYLSKKLINLNDLLTGGVPVIVRRLLTKSNIAKLNHEIAAVFKQYGKYENFWLELGLLELKGRKMEKNGNKLILSTDEKDFLLKDVMEKFGNHNIFFEKKYSSFIPDKYLDPIVNKIKLRIEQNNLGAYVTEKIEI